MLALFTPCSTSPASFPSLLSSPNVVVAALDADKAVNSRFLVNWSIPPKIQGRKATNNISHLLPAIPALTFRLFLKKRANRYLSGFHSISATVSFLDNKFLQCLPTHPRILLGQLRQLHHRHHIRHRSEIDLT